MPPLEDTVHDSTPVLVGVGRYTFHRKNRPKDRPFCSLLEMRLEAARRAIVDAGLTPQGITLNSVCCVSAATEARVVAAAGGGKMASLGDNRLLYSNSPGTVAAVLGCPVGEVRELIMTGDSGSVPQVIVNRAFEQVAQ